MIEVGSAVLSIIPSAKGFGGSLQKQTAPEVDKAATSAGKGFAKKFADALGVNEFKKGLREGMRAGIREADDEATRGGKKSGGAFVEGMRDALRRGSRGIQQEVDRATDTSATSRKSGEKAGKSMAVGMGGALKAGIAGVAAYAGTGVITGLIKDAEESAKVGAKTTAIIKATGGAAKISAVQVGELATSISNKTAMDDELIQTGANMLLTFKNVRNEAGKNNDVFNRATMAAADLSAAGFGSVDGAAKMLGKALNDPVKGMSAMSRAGVTFTAQQQEQVKALVKSGDVLGAQKIILKEVEGQVGGTAAASATGSEKMAVAWGNFREEMGAKLLPVFNTVVTFVTATLLPAIQRFADYLGSPEMVARFTTIKNAVTTFAAAVMDFWNRYAKPALSQFWTFVTTVLAPMFQSFVVETVLPLMKQAGDIIKQAWETVILPALSALWAFITNTLVPVIQWLWGVISPIMKFIAQAFMWAIRVIILPILSGLITGFFWVTDKFGKLKDAFVSGWNIIKDAGLAAWKWIDSKVLSPFKTGFDKLKTFFGTIVDGIGTTWDKIKDKISAPLKWVINEIIRDKLAAAWNFVADKLSLPKWDFPGWADGGKVAAKVGGYVAKVNGVRQNKGMFYSGGWTGPGSTYTPAGVVHADEFVIRKQSQRALSRNYPGLLDHLNTYGTLPGDGGYASGGMVYPSLMAWVKKNLPGVGINSTYRPGSITASGNRSYHSMGMAVDISPSMAAFNKILATFGPSIAELIFSPAGGRQIKNGRPYLYQGAVRAQHFNHVHWAMRSKVGDVPPGTIDGLPTDGGGFSIANPIAEGLKKIIDPLVGGARGLIDRIGGIFGDSDPAKMATSYAKLPVDAVDKWLRSKIDQLFPPMGGVDASGPGDLPASGGVQKWAPLVQKALGMLGQPTSLVQTVLRRMKQESGGNARAINNWDSNARAGIPSKGLMQVIDPTFRAHMMPGFTNIWDPLSNILASMRYALKRYGSLSAAYNRKGGYAAGGLVPELYDNGGVLPPGLTLVSNQTGKYETVRTAEQEQDLREKMAARTGEQIIVNGVKMDTIGEFSDALTFALTRQQNRRRYR